MRHATRLLVVSFALVLLAGAPGCSKKTSTGGSDGCSSNSDCAPGEACLDSGCERLCDSDRDCDTGLFCESDVCVPGQRADIPTINAIDADGGPDTAAGHVDHRIDRTLTILGENLAGADATLSDGSNSWPLEICSNDGSQMVVTLPQGLVDGADYTLSVATQAGACDTTLPVLQGQQGPAGADGAQGDAGGGLAMSFELDETASPTTFADTSPYDNSAAIAGPGGVSGGATGHTGFGVSFAGGVLQVAAGNSIPDSPVVWVEAWIRPQAPFDATRVIVMKDGAYTLKQVQRNLRFEVTAAGGSCGVTGSGDLLTAGTFSHVSGWYDGLTVAVTVDGVIRGRASCTSGPIEPSAGSAVFIGGNLDSGGTVSEDFNGIIDSPRIWHSAPRLFDNPSRHSNIVNVTVHVSNTQRAIAPSASISMESFSVDKKSPTSILLVEGTISGHGNASGSMTQGWTYGDGTEVIAQSVVYDENDHSRILSTTAVISGHTTTGPQTLAFRYFCQNDASGNRPFQNYNPDASIDSRLGRTQSVYRVWEIEQGF